MTPPSENLLQWASAAPSNGFLSLSAKTGANDSQPFPSSCAPLEGGPHPLPLRLGWTWQRLTRVAVPATGSQEA